MPPELQEVASVEQIEDRRQEGTSSSGTIGAITVGGL
jgi:hypothetical protein